MKKKKIPNNDFFKSQIEHSWGIFKKKCSSIMPGKQLSTFYYETTQND